VNYNTLQPDALALQTTVIDWLKSVNNFNNTASIALGQESTINETKEFYREFQQQIDRERRNVEQMELVMVIAAPMKAGKSTIINALVGMDLLPHRAAAMTTLPTEVVFGEEKEPILTLSDGTLSIFQDTWRDLRSKLSDESKIAEAQKKIQQYPHLEKLLKEIQQLEGLPISKETSGCDNLINALTTLNDIVRFCNLIKESLNPLLNLSSVPRIKTSLWRLPKTENLEDGIRLPIEGNLVIVDTPGPNEVGQYGLADVVREQLQKSSMVLLVLDFTGLSAEAAEQIKEDVKKVIDHLGSENLYVLVNKIDQRDELTDMTSDQLIQFVDANLGLFESSNIRTTNRVFECSAKRAFSAANFIQELQQPKAVSISQMRTAKAFNQEMFTEMGRGELKREQIENFFSIFKLEDTEELDTEKKQQLQKFAEKLWHSSGFESFLEKAITVLVNTTVPKVIKNTTKKTQKNLNDLYNFFHIRSATTETNVNEIKNAIESIKNKISDLNKSRSDLNQEVENTINTLQGEINKAFKTMLLQAEKGIQQHLYERFSRDFLADTQVKTSNREFTAGQDKRKLNSQEQADKFFNEVYEEEKKYAEKLLFNLRDSISILIDDQVNELVKSLEKNVQPIIENAWNELMNSFGKDLKFSSLPIKNMMDDVKPSTKNYIFLEKETVFEETTVKRRTWWHWFFIVPVEIKKTVPRINGIYVVLKKDIFDMIMTEIKQNMIKINTKLNEFISDYFNSKIIVIFKEINNSLVMQKNSLMQGIEDNKKSEIQKKQLVEKLTLLKERTEQEIKIAEKYQKYAEELDNVE
jgi:predicted GTPase